MLELILVAAVTGLLGLGCLAAIGWILLSGAEVGVERIFLGIVCAMLGALLLGMSGWIATRSPLRELWKPSPAESASNPNPEAAPKQESSPEEAPKTASKA